VLLGPDDPWRNPQARFFFPQHPELFWGVVASMYIGNALLLALNLPLIGMWVQLLKVPYSILFPSDHPFLPDRLLLRW